MLSNHQPIFRTLRLRLYTLLETLILNIVVVCLLRNSVAICKTHLRHFLYKGEDVVILHKLACISVSHDVLFCNQTSWSLLAAIKVIELCLCYVYAHYVDRNIILIVIVFFMEETMQSNVSCLRKHDDRDQASNHRATTTAPPCLHKHWSPST